MQLAVYLAVVFEIIFVNLLTADSCSKRRYSGAITALSLAGFSIVLVAAAMLLLGLLPFFGNGNGLFVFLGFLYLLPLYKLYERPLRRCIIVMCCAWIYTLSAFAVSVHLSKALHPGEGFENVALLVQSVIFLLLTPRFLRFVRRRFLPVLEGMEQSTSLNLLKTSICWFVTIFCIHFAFVFPQYMVLRLLALVVTAYNALLCYRLLDTTVSGAQRIRSLQRTVYSDSMTGLRNRLCLYRDAEALLRDKRPFCFLYLDLDRFKTVNDQYGHLVGDEYLIAFSKAAQTALGEDGTLYRIAGDEFSALCPFGEPEALARRLAQVSPSLGRKPFLGVSVGCARYPEDSGSLDALIGQADSDMYRRKRLKYPEEK